VARIIVPGEPPVKEAPLFLARLYQQEFLRVLQAESYFATLLRISQLRATMPRRKDGRQDEGWQAEESQVKMGQA
jgi:hypothetical protein